MWRPLCFSEDNHEGVAIGLCWPSLFKDAHTMCKSCDRCQRLGKLTRVDYVFKWIEAVPCKNNDHRVVLKFLKENIFSRFGVPKAIISHGVYGTTCHLPVELGYKAWWAIKQLNMDLSRARIGSSRWGCNYGDACFPNRKWTSGSVPKVRKKTVAAVLYFLHSVFLFSIVLSLHTLNDFGKGLWSSKAWWIGPFTIHQVHSNGVVELQTSNNTRSFKVNGHRLKPFVEPFSHNNEEFILLDPHQA
ncbi:hypothetical protein CK203_061781 [Vitis vinifera]|uniref:Integrase zinc-binding domain-containing protein n=1 Tax=Vitis vinifera TaxID=29760 RepID=A0A438GB44_VITVI|nr:hypothetical protein CK203_061781 [Vitis vinifera]